MVAKAKQTISGRPARLGKSNRNTDCYELLAPYYEEIYGQIDAKETIRQWLLLLEANHLLADFPEKPRLIDIGCGPGWHLKEWRDAGFQVTGVDASPTLLKIARRNLTGPGEPIPLRLADILGPSIFQGPAPFDVAVSHFNFLNLFTPLQRKRLFSAAAKLVRPGGVWIADFTEPHSPPRPVDEKASANGATLQRKGHFVSEANRFDQRWEGPEFQCLERFWFGHTDSAASLASETGWSLRLRMAWAPNNLDVPWRKPRPRDEVLVDVYQRRGR